MESRIQLMVAGRLEGRGSEQRGKRTHGHGQQHGDCWGVRGKRGLNDNGKKYNTDLKEK